LAIIEELMKGKDGLVRAAKIRTAQGMTNHPITKLIPLEVSSDMAGNSSTDTVSNSTADIQTSPSGSSTAQPPDGSNGDAVGQTGRPQRQAARRSRNKVRNWVNELGGPPEDVTD